MAAITNAQVVNFCNINCRPIADLISALDRTLPQFALNVVQRFEKNTAGYADGDSITDGSDTDGRNPVTKVNVAELKFVCEQLAAVMNTANYRALVNNWTVNGQPIF